MSVDQKFPRKLILLEVHRHLSKVSQVLEDSFVQRLGNNYYQAKNSPQLS